MRLNSAGGLRQLASPDRQRTHGDRDVSLSRLPVSDAETPEQTQLGRCPKGWRGVVSSLSPIGGLSIAWSELERRLLEIGFVEGATVEILHDGPIARDPIAVRVNDITVAVRRRDATAIIVTAGV